MGIKIVYKKKDREAAAEIERKKYPVRECQCGLIKTTYETKDNGEIIERKEMVYNA